MKYYIIAGEASGDLHGSNLIKALKKEDPQADICAWGGDLMQTNGAILKKHYRDLAFMGFLEVVKNLPTIFRNFKICKADIADFQPDVLILIDYPGFNLRIATWAHERGIKVFYYISPQIWAWKERRVKLIRTVVDRMFVILPFEKPFYKRHNMDVDFVGHPLLDAFANFEKQADFRQKNNLTNKPIIALLPGSRKQEIQKIMSLMLEVIPNFEQYQFVIAGAPSMEDAVYQAFIKNTTNVSLVRNQTYQLLAAADAAIVTSGTATLETALMNVPQVVVYKGSAVSYEIAKRLVKIKYIALPNLIMDRLIVKELIQHDCTKQNITAALQQQLDAPEIIREDYAILKTKLGNAGASQRLAALIVGYLK
jgi:lipid-A-disaccharide synthase